jgi:hypothetical protein
MPPPHQSKNHSVQHQKKIRQALWLCAALALSLPGLAQEATADADHELGEKYVYCGQLINAVNRAGAGTETSGESALLMSLLGSQLLGADTTEQFKPYRDAARARIEAESREAKSQQSLFNRYLECTQLHAKQSPALLDRFKSRLAINLQPAEARQPVESPQK